MTEKDDAPTLGELNAEPDDAPDTVADALREAMNAAPDDAPPAGDDASAGDEPTRDDDPDAAAAADDDAGDGADATDDGAGDDDVIEPAADWTLEEQEAFRALPAEQQKFVMDRITPASELQTRYTALDELVAPRKDAWARDGMDEVGAIRQLLALSDFAAQNPAEFLNWFAEQRGLTLADDPEKPADGQDDPAKQYADDPIVQGLYSRINELTNQVEQLGGTITARDQAVQQQEQATIDAEIATFASERDDKGNLAHPYFEQVRPTMAALMGSDAGPADLKTAYEQACYANPDVRAKIAAAEKSAAEREDARQRRKKAAAASQASSSVSGQPGARTERQPTGDLREELRANLTNAGAFGNP